MTATFDPEIAKRLIAEAKDDDTRMTEAPWSTERPARDSDGWSLGSVVAGTAPRQAVFSPAKRGTRPEFDRQGIARLRNNARPLADQLEAATAEIDRLNAKLEEPLLDIIRERDRLRAEIVGFRRGLLPDEPGRYDAFLIEKRKRKEAQAEVERMRAVVESAVLVAELDELCDKHPGNDDPVGRKAEAELYEAVRDRTHAVDEYRAGKP